MFTGILRRTPLKTLREAVCPIYVFAVSVCLLRPVVLRADTLMVGPGQQFDTPCAAIASASPGDTILVDADGDYTGDVCIWYQDSLTLRGINGRPRIDAAGMNAVGKGIWVIDGNNTVVDNIEFSGATVPDGNGAGIRLEGYNLIVRNCYFHDNQDGILTNNNLGGEILIEYSEFAYNGTGTGYTHNIYIGQASKFTLRFSYSHHALSGQLVKTRAVENHILYNRLTTEDGTTSYEMDIPNGGLTYVIGNLVEKGPNAQNSNMMSYMLEGTDPWNPDSELFIVNNTLVMDRSDGAFFYISELDLVPAVIQNNIFSGPGQISTQLSSLLINNLSGVDPMLVDPANYDYHLLSGSPAIQAGADPGIGANQSLNPDYEYVHPTSSEVRTTVGIIDIGAYAYTPGSAPELPRNLSR